MKRLLVSACLLGAKCKYSGGSNALGSETLRRLREKWALVGVCPETAGGLPTPRTPSERVGDRVLSRGGEDVTAAFERGAAVACALYARFGCSAALLKENSPSCGSGTVYDGSFSGTLVSGDGVTAEALRALGAPLCGESELEKLLEESADGPAGPAAGAS